MRKVARQPTPRTGNSSSRTSTTRLRESRVRSVDRPKHVAQWWGPKCAGRVDPPRSDAALMHQPGEKADARPGVGRAGRTHCARPSVLSRPRLLFSRLPSAVWDNTRQTVNGSSDGNERI